MTTAAPPKSTPLFEPLTLPNGQVLPNRLVKSAIEENLADDGQLPGAGLLRLYRRWSQGGSGLLITGNVSVHAHALTGPRGVVLDDKQPISPFEKWVEAAKSGGSRVWLQVSHPGRQVASGMPGVAWGPSAVRLNVGRVSRRFAHPIAMTGQQISDTIRRFVRTARLAELVGFDGVQIHAAHGYLLSQFLSPLTNLRMDRWGGCVENRARLLTEVIVGIREVVSPKFAVSIKLNTADFQRGGFEPADAKRVLKLIDALGVDLIELSGGCFESPAMVGRATDGRVLAPEAFFLPYAQELLPHSAVPLVVTGGIRRRSIAEEVLGCGMAAVGMATALAVQPDLPNRWKQEQDVAIRLPKVRTKDATLAAAGELIRVVTQLRLLAKGYPPIPWYPWQLTLASAVLRHHKGIRRHRRWLGRRLASSCPQAVYSKN